MVRNSIGIVMALLTSSLSAQHQQLWLDYQLDRPFANQYLFEVSSSYQTLLNSGGSWRNISVQPSVDYLRFTRLELSGGMQLAYTNQRDSIRTAELDPYLAVRYNFSQNTKFNTRATLKMEERIFHTVEDDQWQNSSRTRFKAESWFAINGPNLFQDHLWYIIADYEWFFVLDQQVHERYANLRRGRLGIGYRINYRNRLEVIYTRQNARNEIGAAFESRDNIIQLRYKMYINPSKSNTDHE